MFNSTFFRLHLLAFALLFTIFIVPINLYSQGTSYTYSPSGDVCKGNVIYMRARNLNNTARTIGFRVYKATTATSCTNTQFAGSGTIQIREGSKTGTIVASQSYSVGASYVDLTVNLSFTSGTKYYYAKVVDSNNDYWDGPVGVTAITLSNPTLIYPNHNYVFPTVPSSITYQWNRNNATSVSTYVLKVRELVNGVSSDIVYESNVGDVSSYTLNANNYMNGGIQAGKSYRWVVYPAGRDDLAAQYFDFRVASSNQTPVLSNGSVSPNNGRVGDMFTFSVTYNDADGDLPVTAKVWYSSNSSYSEGQFLAMNLSAGTGANGTYKASTVISTSGTKYYKFDFHDGTSQALKIESTFEVTQTFKLGFPLAGLKPSNATINSVFDHSMSKPYTADEKVVAYTGEIGDHSRGTPVIIGGKYLYGYGNKDGISFAINGSYAGGGDSRHLYYDGHPGIDFRANYIPCYAVESGIIAYGSDAQNTLIIDHGNGYKSYYLHLSAREVTAGKFVTKGERICTTGEKGAEGQPHLHYELQHNGIPVDPYGWQGNYPDPYTQAQNIYLWDEHIGANTNPIVSSVSVTPNPVLLGKTVEIRAHYFDADGHKPSLMRVHFTYGDWSEGLYKDMVLVSGLEHNGVYSSLVDSFYKSGEVKFKFEALDGKGGKADVLESAFMVNTNPIVSSVSVTPNPVSLGKTVEIRAHYFDADGHKPSLMRVHYTYGDWSEGLYKDMVLVSGLEYNGVFSVLVDGFDNIGEVKLKFEALDGMGGKADVVESALMVLPAESIISGTIADFDGKTLNGVKLLLSGCKIEEFITLDDGKYRFENIPKDIACTVTPKKSGYSFTPPSRSISSVVKNLAWDFIGAKTSFSWSGKIVTKDNYPLKDVLLTLSGCSFETFKSLSDGSYRFEGIPINESIACVVTPSLYGFIFNPPLYSVTGSNADEVEKNFIASHIVSISVIPSNQDVSAGGGASTFVVNMTNSTNTPTCTTNATWLTVTTCSTTQIVTQAAANTGALRSATVTVTLSGATGSPATITVTQAAVEATPTLSVTPAQQTVVAGGGASTFVVSVTNSTNTPTCTANATWLTVTTCSTTQIVTQAAANTGALRSGTVTVTLSGATGSPATITVTQAAGTTSNTASLVIGNASARVGQAVNVPVSVSKFANVGAITLKAAFDPAVLTFSSVTNAPTGVTFTANAVNGVLTLIWFDATGGSNPINIENGKLCDLVFTYNGGTGNVSVNASQSEIADKEGNKMDVGYTAGQVTLSKASVAGKTLYASTAATPLGGMSVSLTPTGATALNAVSGTDGGFRFENLPDGAASLKATKTGGWNSAANGTDAFQASRLAAGLGTFSALQNLAADVNNSGSVNGTDAFLIARRAAGTISSFTRGDWVCEEKSLMIASNDQTADVKCLAVGDVNMSYVPTGNSVMALSKTTVARSLTLLPTINIGKGVSGIALPVMVNEFTGIGAITLKIAFDSSLMSFGKVSNAPAGVTFTANAANGVLTLIWFDATGGSNPINIANGKLLDIEFTLSGASNSGQTTHFTINQAASEVADTNGDPVSVSYENGVAILTKIQEEEVPNEFLLRGNYPNPFNPTTNVVFDLHQASNVTVEVHDLTGRKIWSSDARMMTAGKGHQIRIDAGDWASGIYLVTLTAQGDKQTWVQRGKMVFQK